jgi:hypothetical protein
MLDNKVITEKNDDVTLQSLSELTGFPIEMIKSELFSGIENIDSIQLEDLRSAMMSYLDETMLVEQES